MSLVPCRFNSAHKCKPGRLEIHEHNCPDRMIPKYSHADYIPKTGYVKTPKVHYDMEVVNEIINYIRKENENPAPTNNTNNSNSSYGGNQRKIVGLKSKKKKNRGGYHQDKKLIDNMKFSSQNENEEGDFGPTSKDEIISSDQLQNQNEIGREFEIDTNIPLIESSSNINHKVESNINIESFYDPNEEDRFIEPTNKNWINMKNIRAKLQNRN